MNAPLDSKWSQTPLNPSARQAVELACYRVAPLFDLRDMVAVNPFLGFAGMGFFDATLVLEQVFHEEILPPSKDGLDPKGPRLFCSADRGVTPEEIYRRAGPLASLTKFLSAYVDESAVGPWGVKRGLYLDYKEFAAVDRTPEVRGLSGYSSLVAALPDNFEEALSALISKLVFTGERRDLYFSRLLARIPGFAGLLRANAFLSEEDKLGSLPELFTILLAQDFAIAKLEQDVFGPTFADGEVGYQLNRKVRYQTLLLKEKRASETLVRRLRVQESESIARPSAQLVFCIDVRSERYRKHLERVSAVETYGFAGFFGIPMGVETPGGVRPHCPALLAPRLTPASMAPKGGFLRGAGQLGRSFYQSLMGPVSSLCTVEASGLAYLWKLVSDALPHGAPLAAPEPVRLHLGTLSLDERVSLAKSILKNTGLSFPLSPLVVFVGHDSHVTNNPQAGGLACGACGGHGGSPNAQVAAAILNAPDVRAELASTPYRIEEEVLFLAAEHETVTDSVRLVQPEKLSENQRSAIATLKQQLALAKMKCQDERLLDMPRMTRGEFYKRTRDCAETQPEWGLAGNSAFLIGRRTLSRAVSLSGTAFLHSYDESRDEDGSILEMILTAPAVVTSWINLQYYASTVAPRCFGSGRKTLHNPVGKVGVVEGGQGDLAVGLSRESVFRSDEAGAVHEPLRIHVLVEADPDRIRQIVSKHDSLKQLVKGEWVHLSALRSEGEIAQLEPLRPDSF